MYTVDTHTKYFAIANEVGWTHRIVKDERPSGNQSKLKIPKITFSQDKETILYPELSQVQLPGILVNITWL